MTDSKPRDASETNDSEMDARFETAVTWYFRLRDQPEAPSDEFYAWLAEDARHPLAFAEAESMWGAVERPATRVANEHAVATRKRQRFAHLAIAASVAVAAFALAWHQSGGLDRMRSDYATAPGATRVVALADGTQMTLNTDTAVNVHLNAHERRIDLLRGQAYFAVVHDVSRPFVVRVPTGEVRDIGTRFDVDVRDDGTKVRVDEGSVDVSNSDGTRPLTLRAGERTEIHEKHLPVAAPVEDPVAASAWRRGQIVFYRTPLKEVAAELNRYRRGRIVVARESVADVPVTGIFSTHDTDEAIEIVEETLGVRSLRLTGALVILY